MKLRKIRKDERQRICTDTFHDDSPEYPPRASYILTVGRNFQAPICDECLDRLETLVYQVAKGEDT